MCVFSSPEPYMIDLHMHLIPGVDDGAKNMAMALDMLRLARQQGIRQIFCTPHNSAFLSYSGEIPGLFRELTAAAAAAFPDMTLHPGCEICCTPRGMAHVREALHTGRYPTMNATPYVLTEFLPSVRPEETIPCVEALIRDGYRPIIAHMERYEHLWGHMDLVNRLREMGARIQVNAYSLRCEKDDTIRSWARRLVLEQKADFLGTDAHRTNHRPPSAAEGLQWLYAHADPEYADAIAHGNAQRLLLEVK